MDDTHKKKQIESRHETLSGMTNYSTIEGCIRQTMDIPIDDEADYALTLAWMWDTQDVTCPPHPHQQEQFPSPVANKKDKPCTDIHEKHN